MLEIVFPEILLTIFRKVYENLLTERKSVSENPEIIKNTFDQ